MTTAMSVPSSSEAGKKIYRAKIGPCRYHLAMDVLDLSLAA